jgi:ABC-type glycerol-3-phosphate transport system permease component
LNGGRRHQKGFIAFERQTHLVAGLLLLTAFALSRLEDPGWLYLALLPAFGLLLEAFTGICPMSLILSRMPWNASHLQRA